MAAPSQTDTTLAGPAHGDAKPAITAQTIDNGNPGAPSPLQVKPHGRSGSASAEAEPSVQQETCSNDSNQRAERPTSIVPPFWQPVRHDSRASIASLGAKGITLEDNTEQDEELGPRSPLWARHVDIDEYVKVEGDIRGVGGYIVWLVKVSTLDGGTIILRKRYSEFEKLQEALEATFPKAGSSLPQLPPKSVFYKFRPSFLEKRRSGLAYFLNCILLNPEFAGCPAVRDFMFS